MNWADFDFDGSQLEDTDSELEHLLDSDSEEKQLLENNVSSEDPEEDEEGENLVRPDRISDLPDEILVHILSLLPTTQEAIKTGTLSKRWQFLWTTVPALIFVEDISMTKFIPTVNQTLIQCRNSKIKSFRVHFCYYDDQVPAQINVWIRYAVSCNVEELDLDFSNNSDEDFIKHDVPQHLFNNAVLTYLRLCHVNFAPMGAINWRKLRSLLLWNVWLNEGMIQKILMGSPELEFLELGRCYGFRRLHITSPSVRRLVVFCCFEVHEEDVVPVDVIEVSAPYITSLSIEGNLTAKKFLLHNLRSLLEANVGWYFVNPDEVIVCQETLVELWVGILQSLQHVNEITIGDQCMEALSKLEMKGLRSPVSKRKCLKIASFIRRGWFPGLVNLLESSPDLETLLINADPPFSEKYTDSCHTRANYLAYQKKSVKCLQLHLKTVKIAYFIEWDPESELAQFLLKDGCVLQTVTIFARSVRNRFVNSLSQGLLEGITEKLLSGPRASKDSVVLVKG